MEIIQIVPGLPPWFDGIGDYALRMARHLRQGHGIGSHFLVAEPDWKSNSPDGRVEGFAATKLSARTARDLLDAIARIEHAAGETTLPLLVHFSPYSYQARGCPFWLVDGLERRHAGWPGSVHVAMHELEDHSNKPWKSNFWLPGVQRSLIRRVAQVANFRYTNSELSRGKLESWGSGRFDLILNFSTMEEPAEYPSFAEREPVVVVFGRPSQRRVTYERALHALASVCRSIGATRIVDIGEPLAGHDAPSIEGTPIERCGPLSSNALLRRMSTALVSFIHYPVSMLTKSSVYAVSCSVGTIPYVYEHAALERSCPGLITGEDFVPVSHSCAFPLAADLATLSSQLFRRYQTRCSRVAAAEVARHLAGLPTH